MVDVLIKMRLKIDSPLATSARRILPLFESTVKCYKLVMNAFRELNRVLVFV